jgi:hypothetical protein
MSSNEQQGFGIGYAFYWPMAQDRFDPEMLERAGELARRTRGIVDQTDKCIALLGAVRDLYPDIVQTWAAWDSRAAFEARERPDEQIVVHPQDQTPLGKWLCDNIDERRTTMFLVPVVAWESPEVPDRLVQLAEGNLADLLTRQAVS